MVKTPTFPWRSCRSTPNCGAGRPGSLNVANPPISAYRIERAANASDRTRPLGSVRPPKARGQYPWRAMNSRIFRCARRSWSSEYSSSHAAFGEFLSINSPAFTMPRKHRSCSPARAPGTLQHLRGSPRSRSGTSREVDGRLPESWPPRSYHSKSDCSPAELN